MQNILLSTEVYKGHMGICELHTAKGGRGEGGLSEIDYHPIKGWGGGRNAQTPVVALYEKNLG